MILAILLATLFNTVSSTSTPCSGTTYSVPFPYGASGSTPNLTVAAGGVTLSYPSAWTINKVSSTSTGTITLATACTGTLTITRVTPRIQPTDFRTQGTLDLAALTTALDRIEMQMQESVVQGGGATLSSLTLTTPLPMASGGTGVSSLNCGPGVVTGNGTTLSCVTLSGLAPPGTTGVLLQTTSPGSFQTGSVNIRGNMIVGGVSQGDPIAQLGAATSTGGIYFGGIQGGALKPLAGSRGGLGIYPSDFNTGVTNASGSSFMFFGSTNSSALITGSWVTAAGLGNGGGIISESWAQCNNLNPCVGASGTAFILGAQTGKPVTVDSAASVASGDLLAVNNLATKKFGVDFAGVVTSAGLTSTGPVTATTMTSSGVAAHNGGITVGTSGTAISGSFAGTAATGGGALTSGTCSATTITTTGSLSGAPCAHGSTAAVGAGPYSTLCDTATAGQCIIRTCNNSGGSITFPAATLSCRVFNP
jgi:hypothetical protein